VPVEVTITLLLCDPLPRPYEAILMPSISLVRTTLLSLGTGGPTRRHAAALTQSDFRVSERELLRTAPQPGTTRATRLSYSNCSADC
jgi:hypothetical protein